MARQRTSCSAFTRRFAAAAIAVALLRGGTIAYAEAPPAVAAGGLSTERQIEEGFTKPADQKPRELRFKMLGQVKNVSVKEGDVVKAGQELMALDDADERAEMDILEKDANEIRIEGARISVKVKKAEFERIKKLRAQENSTEAEYEKAEAEAELAELQVVQEQKDLEVKKAKVAKQQITLDRMKLRSPIDAIVLSVDSQAGETVDPSKPAAITIVNNNPLGVVVSLPTAQSQPLKLGQPLRVSYDRKEWKDAKVSFLSPMADASSRLQTVHLEMQNPEGKASGLQCFVELPDTTVAAK